MSKARKIKGRNGFGCQNVKKNFCVTAWSTKGQKVFDPRWKEKTINLCKHFAYNTFTFWQSSKQWNTISRINSCKFECLFNLKCWIQYKKLRLVWWYFVRTWTNYRKIGLNIIEHVIAPGRQSGEIAFWYFQHSWPYRIWINIFRLNGCPLLLQAIKVLRFLWITYGNTGKSAVKVQSVPVIGNSKKTVLIIFLCSTSSLYP